MLGGGVGVGSVAAFWVLAECCAGVYRRAAAPLDPKRGGCACPGPSLPSALGLPFPSRAHGGLRRREAKKTEKHEPESALID